MILPFSLKTCTRGLWHCFSQSYLKMSDGIFTARKLTENEIASEFTIALTHEDDQILLQAKSCVKRFEQSYPQANRVVIIWESFAYSLLTLKRLFCF